MMRSSLFVLALGSVAIAPSMVEAKCARTEARPALLTTRDTKLPDDGGILVGWVNGVYGDDDDDDHHYDHVPADKDPSDQPGWKATDGAKKRVALTRTALAPGLSVYKPAAGTGAVELVDKAGKSLGAFTHDAKAAANKLAAPVIASVKASIAKEMRWQNRRAVAKLSAAPPAEAVVLITYRAKDKAPIAFVRLADSHATLTELDTFEDAGHCGNVVTGAQPPVAGDKVTYAWVDVFGRVSPQSAPIVVK